MKAVVYRNFKQTPKIETMPDPQCADNGVVIKVEATGVCRSDWHGWMGRDADIVLPHIPGHELAGTIAAIGKNVKHWQQDARVTEPFVGGCGHCPQCHKGASLRQPVPTGLHPLWQLRSICFHRLCRRKPSAIAR